MEPADRGQLWNQPPGGDPQKHYPAQFGPPQPGYPPPVQGPGAGPPRKTGLVIAVLAAVVALAVVGVVGVMVLLVNSDDSDNAAAADSSESAAPPPSQQATGATPTPTEQSGPFADLQELPPLSVLGPTWQTGDEANTLSFGKWPFAFRAPTDWNCFEGTYKKIPDALTWKCASGDARGAVMNLVLRKCPSVCDEATKAEYTAAWLDEPQTAKSFDGNTKYVDTPDDGRGRHTVDLSRFFAEEPGGAPVWQVGVGGHAPVGKDDGFLKALNDIVTQTQ